MATVASGLNSGSGFNNSDTITSTTLNNHVNDATVTDIANADIASNAAVAVTKLADITNNSLLGRVDNANNASVPIVIGGSGDAGILFDNDDMLDNSDTAGGSATRGATQQSIKAYTDTQDTSTKNLTLGYNQTYSLVTLTAGAANQNTGSRPIVVMFNLADNEGVQVSNDNVTYLTVYSQSADRGPCTIIVPPNAYYKVTKSSGSITNQAVILS